MPLPSLDLKPVKLYVYKIYFKKNITAAESKMHVLHGCIWDTLRLFCNSL